MNYFLEHIEAETITLSKREKEYIQTIMNTKKATTTENTNTNYDLNYRLKKKFLKMHEDYWTLVVFFKMYDDMFKKRSTDQTTDTLLKAKSQILPQGTLVNEKCAFCKGTNKKLLEINICPECSNSFGL